jgi:hypothetical protein
VAPKANGSKMNWAQLDNASGFISKIFKKLVVKNARKSDQPKKVGITALIGS